MLFDWDAVGEGYGDSCGGGFVAGVVFLDGIFLILEEARVYFFSHVGVLVVAEHSAESD